MQDSFTEGGLVDIKDVHIQQNAPKEEKLWNYIRQIKNPTLYKNGEYTVQVAYNGQGGTLKECIEKLAKRMKTKEGCHEELL